MKRTPSRLLLVLHQDVRFLALLRQAAGQAYEIALTQSWLDLAAAIRTAPAGAVIVVDPYAGSSRGAPAPMLRALTGEFPSAAVIAAMDTSGAQFRDVHTLGTWGVADVLSLTYECTPEAIRRRLGSMHGRALHVLLRRLLPTTLPSRGLSVLMAAADVISDGGGAEDVSRSLLVSSRTLNRWAASSGMPPPRRILAWMRVLYACALLNDPGRSISGVAYSCGYSSDNALRTALHTFVGKSPSRLRDLGALAVAAEQFLADLRGYRQAKRQVSLPSGYGEL